MAASRWRVALLATVVAAAAAGCSSVPPTKPPCMPGNRLGILAQAVPSARYLPCVGAMPAGWDFGRLDVEDGRAAFWLDHDREGVRAAEVMLTATCDTTGAFADGPVGQAERYTRPVSVSPAFAATAYDVFEGGCVTYRYSFAKGENAEHIGLLNQLFDMVQLFPREAVEEELRHDLGQDLTPAES
jgi:hypothetical protein